MPIVIEHPTAEAIFAALQQVPAEELVRLRALMEQSARPVNRSTSWSDEDLQEFSDAGAALYEEMENQELQSATPR